MVYANLIHVVFGEGSMEAAHASGLYGYPHEILNRSKPSYLPEVLAPLQRWLLMTEVLPFNQLLNA